jgi:hypothetical protein
MIRTIDGNFYTLKEAADKAGMTYEGIRSAIKANRLAAFEIRGITAIREDHLEEFLSPAPKNLAATEHQGVQ